MKDYFGKNCASLSQKKLWLFDMDGTVYLGNTLFEGVLELLSSIERNGGKYVFITNNSSKGKGDYMAKVTKMGIKADEDNFYTSVDAAISLLKVKIGDKLIYAQGTKSFVDNLRASGLSVTTEHDEGAECVIVGFDTELTTEKLTNTCKSLLKDVPYYATNPDWACPTEFGYIPDCGSMCFGLEKATGKKPFFIGKPNPTMIEEVMKKFGVQKEEVVVLGDRLYTDIASGVNAGVDTVLVLSGESTLKDYEESEVKPTFVLNHVKEINDLLD